MPDQLTSSDLNRLGKGVKPSAPRVLLQLEGLVVLVVACAFYRELGASWLKFAVLFLAPDLSMFGYLWSKKAGARIYNSVHTYVGPFLLWAVDAVAPAAFSTEIQKRSADRGT